MTTTEAGLEWEGKHGGGQTGGDEGIEGMSSSATGSREGS